MIIAELAGGLGNQMFQYAFALATALRTKNQYYLDKQFLEKKDQPEGFTPWPYGLDIFGVTPDQILPKELESLPKKFQKSLRSKIFRKIAPQWSLYIKEDTTRFHPEYLAPGENVYLRGYWQNSNYFNDYKKEVLEALTFQTKWTPSGETYSQQILNQENSVCIHVRRGDYLKNPFNQKICTPEYYKKAIDHFRDKNPYFFIFSDEPEWVTKNFGLEANTTIVDRKGSIDTNYEDMRLMSLCKHNIIANSSFSWWGAYLGNNHDKIVIAPKTWDQKRSSKDICPKSWKLI